MYNSRIEGSCLLFQLIKKSVDFEFDILMIPVST